MMDKMVPSDRNAVVRAPAPCQRDAEIISSSSSASSASIREIRRQLGWELVEAERSLRAAIEAGKLR